MTTQDKKSRLISLAVAVILAVSFVLGLAWKKKQDIKPQYRQVPVKRGDLNVTILATGVVAPENRVDIKPPIAGRAEQVLVDEGYNVKKGQVLVWMSSTERAALLDAAQARGREELKRWEELYKPTPVLAPIDGTIIARNVEPGQTFAQSDSILSMSDRLTIDAQVDETDIAQVRLGESATVVLDAYPNEKIPAKVNKIAYDAKTVNNVTTYIVEVLPLEVPPQMRSGMTANVTFNVTSKQNVLLIPADAIKVQQGRFAVLVAGTGDEAPQMKPISTGASDGKRTEVVSGLSEGDVILVPELKSVSAAPQTTNPFSPMSRSNTQRQSGSRPSSGGAPAH